MGAAPGAFKPLAGLAAEGFVPLAEIRELMSSTVEGTLFFGSMLTFMAQDACTKLDALQLEFARKLLEAPPWFSATLVRSAAGWQLSWGERVLYEALVFRAELWCCESHLLVRQVWGYAQGFGGRRL